jgi:23S rRNA (cytosine1962-C5)-methyltransferase
LGKQTFISNTSGLDYQLLDCGNGRKLERYGEIILDRPEVNAFVKKTLNQNLWGKAHFRFEEKANKKGQWTKLKNSTTSWLIGSKIKGRTLKFQLELTNYKHIGLFPEQFENWNYINSKINEIKGEVKVLNLFAYTGAANIVAAKAGAKVTHIDSIKQITNWARNNAAINEVENIRWIVEDARKFVLKAEKRGDLYHGIIMDPPTFGYGAKKEIWAIEKDLIPLLKSVKRILEPDNHFFIMNTYSPLFSGKKLIEKLKGNDLLPKEYEFYKLGLSGENCPEIILGDLIRYSTIK